MNDRRIDGPTPLRSGDLIRVGRNVIKFGERQKRPAVDHFPSPRYSGRGVGGEGHWDCESSHPSPPTPLPGVPGERSRSCTDKRSTMPYVMKCPHCSTAMSLPDGSAGKQFRCVNCKQPFTAAGPAAACAGLQTVGATAAVHVRQVRCLAAVD